MYYSWWLVILLLYTLIHTAGSYSLAFVIATVLGAVSIVLSLLIRTKSLHGEFTAR